MVAKEVSINAEKADINNPSGEIADFDLVDTGATST